MSSEKKLYLAVCMGSEDSKKLKEWEALEPAAQKKREQQGMEAWGKWVQEREKAIVENGAPLGSTLRVDSTGVKKAKNDLCAYVVVRASSHEEAAKMFLNHPHFSIFPGDSVEIMECLDIP